GRTRARTLASTRTRPKSPVFGSSTTITSASPTATPSWSSACSVASSTVFPATSTHSTLYRAFLFLLARDRGCAFGVGSCAPPPEPAPLVACFPEAGFLPLAAARPLVPEPFLVGGNVAL